MPQINFFKKREIYLVTGAPPITENSHFISVMKKFNCKIEGVESFKQGEDETVMFWLNVPVEKYEEVSVWIQEHAKDLEKT